MYETAKVAANWWRKSIENPSFNNGDNSRTGLMTRLMAGMLTADVDPEIMDKFEQQLAEVLTKEIDKTPYVITFGVDYHPDMLLSNVAKEVGLDTNNWSWKTMIWIDKDTCKVSAGYGSPMIDLMENIQE